MDTEDKAKGIFALILCICMIFSFINIVGSPFWAYLTGMEYTDFVWSGLISLVVVLMIGKGLGENEDKE